MSIEITDNTLLKLIVRQGSDTERKNIVLDSGEIGFTTDTERLFIGNGIDNGGVLIGNLFIGSGPDLTFFAPGEIGDLAYNNDINLLFRIKENDGSNLSDWESIGGSGISSDTTQSFGGTKINNLVRVTNAEWTTLSAGNNPNTFYIISDVNYTQI
jgi:hypothetical protein